MRVQVGVLNRSQAAADTAYSKFKQDTHMLTHKAEALEDFIKEVKAKEATNILSEKNAMKEMIEHKQRDFQDMLRNLTER